MENMLKLIKYYNKYRKNTQYKIIDYNNDFEIQDYKVMKTIPCNYQSLKEFLDEEIDGETQRQFRLGLIIKSDVIPERLKSQLKSYCVKFFRTVLIPS